MYPFGFVYSEKRSALHFIIWPNILNVYFLFIVIFKISLVFKIQKLNSKTNVKFSDFGSKSSDPPSMTTLNDQNLDYFCYFKRQINR